ncbi:hypothetical protein CYLTODRAFT_358634 [Cylindrobasidium torrendii FP15055 ss-10]|uniref:MULE transposase domain-containing protein n=1 Tax=Cylindrobasidium torrendii FP15055 ss-10 TaxID=1314674 RepID=A0A0D7B2B0_9AGAR|nr:hypothetical protein CYLTODRAFT_358634 [Cylindrobasidium torrendii FP15055 ss-10]
MAPIHSRIADTSLPKCSGCKRHKSPEDFPLKVRGNHTGKERTAVCSACTQGRKSKKSGNSPLPIPKLRAEHGLPVEKFSDFLTVLKTCGHGPIDLEVNVMVDTMKSCLDDKDKARQIADMVGDAMNYKFNAHKVRDQKTSDATEYQYYCAQNAKRVHRADKVTEESKQRDKLSMQHFECNGWLKLTLDPLADSVLIRIVHSEPHVPYCCISIPDDIRDFIINAAHTQTVTQIWEAIIHKHPKPTFTRKAVYSLWFQHYRVQYYRDDDQVKSARTIITEVEAGLLGSYAAENIPLPEEPGFTAIAWALPDMLRQWAGRIREIAVDSTWKTNALGYELYAVIGETYGSGMPLAFLLLKSDDGAPGGKQRYLECLFRHLQICWKLRPAWTLSDKDLSEINALCTVKQRVSTVRRAPAFYHADKAHEEFDFIRADFLPIGQLPSNVVRKMILN